MKKTLQMAALIVAGVAAGAFLHECQSPKPLRPPELSDNPLIDTIHYYDTIPYYLPVAKQEVSLGTQIKLLPVFIPKDNAIRDSCNIAVENILASGNIDVQNIHDSVMVEIPMTQKEYESDDYHAWVSGYEPQLDSIFVYPKSEVVTIRYPPEKQKRWGIGVFAGYGITPHGLQPCAGVSINYNLINF